MENPQLMRGTYRFGVFEVDVRAGELRKQGTRIKLQDQPFQVLLALLEEPGEVITREQLQKKVWPAETFVDFDHGVNNAIRRLRETLGDSADNPRFIETLSRRGYRFIAPVAISNVGQGVSDPQTVAPVSRRRRLHWWGIAAAILVLAVGAFLAARAFRARGHVLATSSAQIRSLAVLPFANLSGDPAQEYFSDGMTDALITDLAQIPSIKVISRTSTIRYKKTEKPLPDIARELDVDGIIEGTVQRSGDRVRITAQLIQAPSDKHLWANSYERDIHDAFALERDLTQEIAREIQAQLKTPSQARFAQIRTVDAKALEAYLQGNYYLNRFTEEDMQRAQEYFRQAIDADPSFAAAYSGLAQADYGRYQGSTEDTRIAKSTAEKALELDPTLSDAMVTLGRIKLESWDWPGMEEEYRKAIAVNPNNALAHQELGEHLDAMGRLDEGLKECQIAQRLDPSQDHLSSALFDRGEFEHSVELMLIILRKDPDNVVLHHDLYLAYQAMGMDKEAIQHLERTWTLAGFPEVGVSLHHAFAVSGYRGAMREYAIELEHLHATRRMFLPVNLAGVHAILGNKERAFYWLEQAYEHGPGPGIPLWQTKLYPALDPLRSDPRFKVLLHHIGLPG